MQGECAQNWFVMLISGTCGIVNRISGFMALVQELTKINLHE